MGRHTIQIGQAFAVSVAACVAACDGAPVAGADGGDAALRADASEAACPVRGAGLCPEGWVRTEVGGCGPAVVVCAPDGGAAAGVCDRVDLSAPGPAGFFRGADGGVAGPWTAALAEAGRGAPPDGFSPDAGVRQCPSRWAVARDVSCDPRVGTACPVGTLGLPGQDCTATGEAECGTDPWPTLPASATGAPWIHVRAGASADGADGTMQRPFPTIVSGLERAPANAWLRVAAGSYAEGFTLTRSMHIVGACAARSSLALPAGATFTVAIAGEGAGVRLDLRGLTVRGGVRAARGATIELARMRFEDAPHNALVATGAGSTISASEVVVTRSTTAPAGASGVLAVDGGRVNLSRSAVAQGPAVLLRAVGAGSSVYLSSSAVGPSVATEVPESAGVLVQGGGSASLLGVALGALRGRGVVSMGLGSSVTLEDVVVRDVSSSVASSGEGIAALDGGSANARRLVVERCTYAGVHADGVGSTIVVNDAVVRDGRFDLRSNGGFGLAVTEGATLEARGVSVIGNNMTGVFAGTEGRGRLSDCIVRGTRSGGAFTTRGYGISADRGGHLTVSRTLVDDNLTVGVGAIETGSTLELMDSVVRDTTASGGRTGFGLAADQGATLRAIRTRVEASTSSGVYSARGSTIEVDHCVVRATRPRDPADISGDGLKAERGTLRATATLVEANTGAGAIAADRGALTLTGCVVRATAPTGDMMPEVHRGYGVVATTGATLRGSATVIDDNTESGALATGVGSTLALEGCAVRATRRNANDERGIGLSTQQGASATLDGVLIEHSHHAGLIAFFRATVTVNDVLVLDTQPDRRGFGLGIAVHGATVTGARWAVVDAGGVGVSAAWSQGAPDTRVQVDGLFVRDVSAQGVSDPIAPAQMPVSYGVFVGERTTVEAASASVDRCDWGFFQSLGALTLPGAVMTRHRVALGAANGASNTPSVNTLNACGNRRSEVQRDVALPEVRLPPPREI